jgi:hypothetical protein
LRSVSSKSSECQHKLSFPRTPCALISVFRKTRVAFVYFSLRLLCRFDLAVRAISIRRAVRSTAS